MSGMRASDDPQEGASGQQHRAVLLELLGVSGLSRHSAYLACAVRAWAARCHIDFGAVIWHFASVVARCADPRSPQSDSEPAGGSHNPRQDRSQCIISQWYRREQCMKKLWVAIGVA